MIISSCPYLGQLVFFFPSLPRSTSGWHEAAFPQVSLFLGWEKVRILDSCIQKGLEFRGRI